MRCQGSKVVRHDSARGFRVLSGPDGGQAECQAFQYLRFSESFRILPSSGTVRRCNLLRLGP
jgi:hypothetical protein